MTPNVIVSAILNLAATQPHSFPLAMRGEVQQLFLSPALLAEYTEVVKRPVFGFNPKSVDRFLKELESAAHP